MGIVFAWCVLLDGRRSLRGTTLVSVEIWSFLVATAWTLIWVADQCFVTSAPLADHLWYGCAVLALCPPIAVLGSRRPGTRVWTWFILLPMLFALCWPIAALWWQGSELHRLQLETPQLVAFCLVLVMGVGNYCGTTYTASALLYGSAILALVISNWAKSPGWLTDRESIRYWCTVVMVVAVILLRKSARPTATTKFDRVWFDFFDLFGIVWGRRIQDRVNFIAVHEGLPVRLELHGFVWLPTASDALAATPHCESSTGDRAPLASSPLSASQVHARVEHILRWLLRRFVDRCWIDERLGSGTGSDIHELKTDS